MARDRLAERLIANLEARVDAAFADRDRVALAYSGGVASTLIAAIARKRGDLTCIVVGVDGSPDLEAARVAESYLDYRLELVTLSPAEALRLARRVAAAAPRLSLRDVLALAPAFAASDRMAGNRALVGFGASRLSAGQWELLASRRLDAPLRSVLAGRGGELRALAIRCATTLGLPRDFARPRRRAPASGSGIESVLRGIATSKGTTFPRLLRPHHYH